MSHSSHKNTINLDNINLASNDISVDDMRRIINYLVGKLFEAMENPTMFAEVQSQLHALQAPPSARDERVLERPPGETSTRRDSLGNEEE